MQLAKEVPGKTPFKTKACYGSTSRNVVESSHPVVLLISALGLVHGTPAKAGALAEWPLRVPLLPPSGHVHRPTAAPACHATNQT